MAVGEGLGPPVIVRYTDYRAYLSDFYYYRKSTRSGFSYRLFAQKAGLKSPNYLQLVIQGKRSLTDSTASKIALAMGLKGAEKEYFISLVRKSGVKSPSDAQEAEKQHRIAIRKLISRQIQKDQSRVLSEWYFLVVRELVMLRDFNPDPHWISEKLRGLITVEQAEEALKLLVSSGFLKIDSGKYEVAEPVIDTGDAFGEVRVLHFHQETLATWRKVLELVTKEERQLGLMSIPISSARIPELKKRIRAFQDEIVGWLQDEKEPDRVVQLGTYLIPVSLPGGESKNET